jgi:hypothetical protein
MNDAGFSSDDERWPLMAVLTWIATRSLKLTERLAFCDPVEAGQFLFETRKMFGAPCKISYSDAFHSLNEKIGSRAIVGSGSKIKWTIAPTHEQLPIENCFSLAKLSDVFEACAFRPQALLNANRGDSYTLILHDFTSMMWIASLPREADLALRTRTARVKGGRGKVSLFLVRMFSASGGIGLLFPRGSRQERVLGNRRAAFRPIGLRTWCSLHCASGKSRARFGALAKLRMLRLALNRTWSYVNTLC